MTSEATLQSNTETILVGPGATVPAPHYHADHQDESGPGGLLSAIQHALRRRFLAVAVLGALAAATASVAAWYGIQMEYTASARLLVHAQDPSKILSERSPNSGGSYELDKRTHLQQITSSRLLASVLGRDDKLKGLQIIREQENPVQWLKSCVSASFPDDSKLMDLRVRSADVKASEALAGAIREAYISEVKKSGTTERDANIRRWSQMLLDFETRFQAEQNKLAGLVRQAEAANSRPPPSPEEIRTRREYELKRRRLDQIQARVLDLNFYLNALETDPGTESTNPEAESVQQESEIEDGGSLGITDAELQKYLTVDPTIRSLQQRLESLERIKQQFDEEYHGEALQIALDRNQLETARIKEKISRKTDLIRDMLIQKKQEAIGAAKDPALLRAERDALQANYETISAEVDADPNAMEFAESGPRLPSTAEIMQELRVQNLKSVIARVQQHIDEAKLAALQDTSQGSGSVEDPDNGQVFMLDRVDQQRKALQTGAAGGFAFLAVAALIVLWDLRRGRLNHTDEVSEQLNINVLGALPLLRGKGAKRLESSQRLAESVDGVAAALLCQTSGEMHRVVMICSAMPGEGKTTLAANLATSLAAAGRRTLLIDFDLRRPMLHKVYQCPIGPGIGELLSTGAAADLVEFVQETDSDNLWLIPAGAQRQGALAELSTDRVPELFEELKEHFEYIIVDGPPVLPVVDTRLVARHADGVMLSLLRDVSELSKVKSACQLLQSYRVNILGGVVIGSSGELYYGYPMTRASTPA